MEETKVIYHLNDEDTPYLIKLPISADKITLGDLKNALGKPNYKYFFKSMDDDFGVVKEEIGDDFANLPCFNGRVVSWLVASDSSVSDTHSQCAESVAGDGPKESRASPSSRDGGTAHDRLSTGDPSANKRRDLPQEGIQNIRDHQLRNQQHLPPRSHGHRRSERQRRPTFDPSGSSIMSSDIETTSFVDSDDDASSRFTATTETTAASSKYGHLRQRRRRHKLPVMTRASSFSSITDSTMSLNIVTVTLNLDVVKFLGISIVGQSNKGGDGGIYVGSIMKGGAVALDGRIEPGDMILEVNDISFENMSNDEAVRVLREVVQKNGPVKLVVAKCWDPNPRGYFLAPPPQEPIRPIDPSAWVAHTEAVRSAGIGAGGMYGPLGLPFSSMTSTGSSISGSIQDSEFPYSEMPLTLHTDLSVVAKAMARPDSGLEIRDRMWLKITIPHAFIGSDLIDWLITNVKGLDDRREARKYANSLLREGYIRHTVNKLNFSEQCYYTIGIIVAPAPGFGYAPELPMGMASNLLPASLKNLSSLTLEDIDSVSEVNRCHSTKPSSAWVNQYTSNPYGPSYIPAALGYAPPPPYNLVTTTERSHSSGSNKPNETTHSGSGSSASGSSRSQGGHKMAPLMSGSDMSDISSVLSSRRYSPSDKNQGAPPVNPSQQPLQQTFNLNVTHPYLSDNLEIMGDL